MALWTVAALAYSYSIDPSLLKLAILGMLTPISSIAYYELNRISEVISQTGSTSDYRRDSSKSKSERILDFMGETVFANGVTKGMLIIALNFLIAIPIYVIYIFVPLFQGRSEIQLVVLFLLPMIWGTLLIWRVAKIAA